MVVGDVEFWRIEVTTNVYQRVFAKTTKLLKIYF